MAPQLSLPYQQFPSSPWRISEDLGVRNTDHFNNRSLKMLQLISWGRSHCFTRCCTLSPSGNPTDLGPGWKLSSTKLTLFCESKRQGTASVCSCVAHSSPEPPGTGLAWKATSRYSPSGLPTASPICLFVFSRNLPAQGTSHTSRWCQSLDRVGPWPPLQVAKHTSSKPLRKHLATKRSSVQARAAGRDPRGSPRLCWHSPGTAPRRGTALHHASSAFHNQIQPKSNLAVAEPSLPSPIPPATEH